MKKHLIATALMTLPLFAMASPETGTNLLNNGSFESEPLPAGSVGFYANLTGWTGGAGGIEVRNAVAGTAFEGSNFVELDVYANSSISQAFTTVAGQIYQLSFAYAERVGTVASSNGMSWSAGNMSDVAFGQDANTSWTVENATFVATSASTTLTFTALGTSDGLGTSLDDVSVNAVPEPGSLALLTAGLGALGWAGRRRAIKRA